MVQFAGWEMPLVYEGTHKNRVAGGAGKSIVHSYPFWLFWNREQGANKREIEREINHSRKRAFMNDR